MKVIKSLITDKSISTTVSKTGLLKEESMNGVYSIDKNVVMLGKGCCGNAYAERARVAVEVRRAS